MRRPGQQPIRPARVRSLCDCGFALIPNRFLHDGFFAALHGDELVLYFLLVLAGDRNGLSYSPCSLAGMPWERYVAARNALINKDLVAFDGCCFQVLSLPRDAQPHQSALPLQAKEEFEERGPATVRSLIQDALGVAAEKAT